MNEKKLDNQPFLLMENKSDYTYLKANGETLTCNYDEHYRFSEGLALVKKDDKYGFINSDGKEVVKPKFQYAVSFKEGLAPVLFEKVWSYINPQGEFELQFTGVKKIGCFSQGLAFVKTNELFGYIDRKGNWIIEPRFEFAGDFSEGYAAVQVGDLWGHISLNGEMLYKPCWKEVYSFSEGLAVVVDNKDKSGYIDVTGKLVIKPKWNGASGFSEGLALVYSNNDKYGYIDKNGKTIIKTKFDIASSFSDGLAAVEYEDHFFYIDKNEETLTYSFKFASKFENGLAEVQTRDGWIVINTAFDVVIDAKGQVPAEKYTYSLRDVKERAAKTGITVGILTDVENELESAEDWIQMIEDYRKAIDDKRYKHSLFNLYYQHMRYGKAKYILKKSPNAFFSSLQSACDTYALYIKNKMSNTPEGETIDLDKDSWLYFIFSWFYADKQTANKIRNYIQKIELDKTRYGVEFFAHAVVFLAENNNEMAKVCIERFINLHEEGCGYISKILNALLFKDSNLFNRMMNQYLEACFNEASYTLPEVADEQDYLEMLAMERGLTPEGLIKKIKSIAKRRKLDFDGIEELPENELILFVEENHIFKNSIPTPWFIELSNIGWIFDPGLALIALAKHRGMNVNVEHPFVPTDLQK